MRRCMPRSRTSLEFCLAAKMYGAKKGAPALRSASNKQEAVSGKDPAELDKHAKNVYDFINPDKVSRIRMLLQWQGAGGLTHCIQAHHRAVTCHRLYGDSTDSSNQPVSLEKFQRCVRGRHSKRSSSGSQKVSSQGADDFAR